MLWKKVLFVVSMIVLFVTLNGCSYLVSNEVEVSGENTKISWGIGKKKDVNGQPVDTVKANQTYLEYNAYFVGANYPVIYLTFDNGYENGNTSKILDILKDNDIQAVFFLTGDYAIEEFELVNRMINEGHKIGNHSFGHKDYANLNTEDRIKDLGKLHHLMEERYGYTMKLFRFPKGEFSMSALQDVKNYGYMTLFWSFAYVDYNINNQPSDEQALKKLVGGLHNGAIYLLHSVSSANVNVLDDFIKQAHSLGYTFTTYQ